MSDRGHQDYSPAVRRFTIVALPVPIKPIRKRDGHGHEHIPRSGGVIVAANHLSYADWAAMALFIHQAGRYPAFLIKSSAFNVKVVGPFLRAAGQFPVNRGAADAALVLNDAERGLAKGECLIFYPEGTATRDPDLWPMVPKTGVARLALATGAPVIPVAQWGTQDILPYGTKSLHVMPRHTVKMLAGPPVDLSGYDGQPLNRDVLRAAAATIMADNPPRGDPRPPARHHAHAGPARDRGRRRGAGRSRPGGARRSRADAARQPHRLARPAAPRGGADQPDEGHRTRHPSADERGDRGGHRPGPAPHRGHLGPAPLPRY